jgi:Ran GTPase-activating protein (RanGAP) involved in mRNA processing and transport
MTPLAEAPSSTVTEDDDDGVPLRLQMKQLKLANQALLLRCSALERDLKRAASDSFELDEVKSNLAELALVSDEAEAHRMRADSLQALARQLTEQLDEQQRHRKLEAIGERAETRWQHQHSIEQAAQSVAHMRSEVREARECAERLMADKADAERRLAALQGELERARNQLQAVSQFAPAPVEKRDAQPDDLVALNQTLALLHRQPWYRGFTANFEEWRLADVPLDADALLMQQQLVHRLRAALPPAAFALQFLDLSRTSLHAADADAVAALLIACPPLSSVHLDGNALGDAGCELLCASLRSAPDSAPVHLSVRGCGLGALSCGALATLAQTSPRLMSLNVSENRLGPEGGAELARAVRRDGSNVKSISARGCALRSGAVSLARAAVGLERLSIDLGDADDVDPVATRLALLSALSDTLHAQARHHGARAAAAAAAHAQPAAAAGGVLSYLATWWSNAPAPETASAAPAVVPAVDASIASLKSLSMSVTGLGGVGLAMLTDALKTNETLTLLCLTHSNLTDRCAQLLFIALAHHHALRELDVSHNEIGDFGAQFVSDLLANPALLSVCLDANRIGAAGAALIANAVLAHGKSLRTLRLADNALGDGLAHFAPVIQNAASLEQLDLRRCGSASWLSLEKAILQRDSKLKQITVTLEH